MPPLPTLRELYENFKPLLGDKSGPENRADFQQENEDILIEQTNRGPGYAADGKFPVYKGLDRSN